MSAKKEKQDVLTDKQLAAEWGVSYAYLKEARNKLGLPHYKLGRMIRYVRGEVENWFNQRKVA